MNYIKDKKGFTLIEVLVSIVLISILSFAFSRVVITSFRGTDQSELTNKAINWGQSIIEYFRDQDQSFIAQNTGNIDYQDLAGIETIKNDYFNDFAQVLKNTDISISSVDSSEQANLYQVTVYITWKEKNKLNDYQLSTYIYKELPQN